MKRLFPLLLACTSAPPTLDDYQRAAVTALCQYYARCGTFSESQEASCESGLAAQIEAAKQIYSVEEAVSARRLAFDAAGAAACVNSVRTAHCDTKSLVALGQDTLSLASQGPVLLTPYTITNAACTGLLTGLVSAGGSCRTDNECKDGWCSVVGNACAGTCMPFATTDCSHAPCAPGHWCKGDPSSGSCVPLAGQGADCSASVCADGLWCQANLCQPPGSLGDSCTIDPLDGSDLCAPGLYCDPSTLLCRDRQPSGGACSSYDQCSDGLSCTSSGSCQPLADLGQSCAGASCAGDAVCDLGLCKLTGQAGDDCSAHACGLNLYCSTQNSCAPQVAFGASCDQSQTGQCSAGYCKQTCMYPCM